MAKYALLTKIQIISKNSYYGNKILRHDTSYEEQITYKTYNK